MNRCITIGLLLGGIATAGCGGGPTAPPPPQAKLEASKDNVKSRLEIFVQTGMVGSGAAGMKEAIQALPADKSGPLLTDYEELIKAGSNSAKVKEIAKRMADKL